MTGGVINTGWTTKLTVIELVYGECPPDSGSYIPSGSGGSSDDSGSGTGGGGSSSEPSGDPSIGVLTPAEPLSPEEMLELKVQEVKYHLELNPFGLLGIPKDQTTSWRNLAYFSPPAEVIDRLNNLKANQSFWQKLNPYGTWNIQSLQNAEGAVVSMDFFSVSIEKMPLKNGVEMTPAELLYEIRQELIKDNTTIINTSLANFSPHPDLIGEEQVWGRSNPITSILSIDMLDNGSVITSNATGSSWIFTTLQAPTDYQHPVSGNREFGISKKADGGYIIYTRGVDRATGAIDAFAQKLTNNVSDLFNSPYDPYFDNAEKVWRSFQEGIKKYIDSKGGSTTIQPIISDRVDYRLLYDILNNEVPSSIIVD